MSGAPLLRVGELKITYVGELSLFIAYQDGLEIGIVRRIGSDGTSVVLELQKLSGIEAEPLTFIVFRKPDGLRVGEFSAEAISAREFGKIELKTAEAYFK